MNEDTIAMSDWIRTVPMVRPETFSRDLDSPVLCLVADGLGGHHAGARASAFAARYLVDRVAELQTTAQVETQLHGLNAVLIREADLDATAYDMGTTIAGVVIQTSGLVWFNIGDSRIYKASDQYLRQLSVDDRASDPGIGPVCRAVTQALGGGSIASIAPHVAQDSASAGDVYLLCSDGLTDVLALDAIEAHLSDDHVSAVSKLFDLAMESGGEDNISIVVVRLLGGGTAPLSWRG